MSRTRPVAAAVLTAALVVACATTTSPTGRTQYVGAILAGPARPAGCQGLRRAEGEQAAGQRCRATALCRPSPIPSSPACRPSGGPTAGSPRCSWTMNPMPFALPGVRSACTGIFRVARDQDQLAAVIAHGSATWWRATMMSGSPGGWARPVRSTCWGAGGRLRAGGRAGGSILAQAGFLLPNSRAQESEADVVGQRLMAGRATTRGAVVLWRNMAEVGVRDRRAGCPPTPTRPRACVSSIPGVAWAGHGTGAARRSGCHVAADLTRGRTESRHGQIGVLFCWVRPSPVVGGNGPHSRCLRTSRSVVPSSRPCAVRSG